MSGYKEQLQQKLREGIGSDVIPLIKNVNISALSSEQLEEIMLERNISIEGTRRDMEKVLIASLGSNKTYIVDMVMIDSLNIAELEKMLSGISRPGPGYKEQLQQKLREGIGSDVIPLIKNVNISALSSEQLEEIMLERNISIEGTRRDMEKVLIASLGSNKTYIVDMVMIDSLNIAELEKMLSGISRPATARRKTIREAQQELAQNCGFGSEILWDLLRSEDAEIMKNKVKQLIPDQKKRQTAIENFRQTIFETLWAQRKYTNGKSVSYIFYVMVTKDGDFDTAQDSTEFSCHPVFRCRKCVKNFDTTDCCMIYVDETGRVYQNWKSFIEENVLPAGTMVAPRNGIYNFDQNKKVELDVYCTPSGTTGAQAMSVAQTGSAVIGIGAACVPLAAIALPIAAPIVATAGFIGLGVGAFSAISSALNLSDHKKHEQSISITGSQARASYLGIIGGAVGMAAAGATSAMLSMAAAGKATAGIEVIVNGINITSIVLSGSGVANGVLDLVFKYQDGDQISTLDILQLSASLVLFTHSVYNFQLASEIANNARTNSIKSYRESLSNRQRKIFDKMSKETVRIRGNNQGKMDIIRGVNEILGRQYLNDLFKINKKLNQNDVRPAFGESGGGILLNNELPVDTGVLRQSVQHQKGPNVLEQVSRPIPPTHNSDTYQIQKKYINYDFSKDNSINDQQIWSTLAVALPNGMFVLLKQFGERFLENIADGCKFEDVVSSMADNLPELTFNFIMMLSKNFIEKKLDQVQQALKLFIPTESVLYRILKHITEQYSDLSYENISQKGEEIVKALKTYYNSLNPNNKSAISNKCPNCNGMFYICQL